MGENEEIYGCVQAVSLLLFVYFSHEELTQESVSHFGVRFLKYTHMRTTKSFHIKKKLKKKSSIDIEAILNTKLNNSFQKYNFKLLVQIAFRVET